MVYYKKRLIAMQRIKLNRVIGFVFALIFISLLAVRLGVFQKNEEGMSNPVWSIRMDGSIIMLGMFFILGDGSRRMRSWDSFLLM